MAKQKCPICNGKVYLEYCEDCGYRVPNEETISSQYNYDPSDYPVPEFEKNVMPEIPSPPEYKSMMDEKVNDYSIPSIPQTPVADEISEVNPYAEKLKDFTPYDNGGWQKSPSNQASSPKPNDMTGGIYNQPYKTTQTHQKNENPYANKNFTPYNNNSYSSDEGTFRQFIKEEWFRLIFIFIGSFIGIVWGIVLGNIYKSRNETKYINYRKYLNTILIIRVILAVFIHF